MKSRAACLISVFTVAVVLSFGAHATSETPPAGQATHTEPTTRATSTTTTPQHSHMTEKLGVPAQQAAFSDSDDKSAAKDRAPLKRHNHQRDMK